MKISLRLWVTLIVVGLAGQLAWTVENMYLNVYLYHVAVPDPRFIAAMVSASAVVATLTTLIMGNFSDRFGRRKIFISGGYILWGISILLFAQVNSENAAKFFPAASAGIAAATMIVILDCVMTFFGSTANDAAFNAYVTERTVPENRGRAESVLAILPPVSMLIVFGALDPLVQRENWQLFFNLIGGIVIAVGLCGMFLIDDTRGERKRSSFFQTLFYGFSLRSVRENRELYLAMAAFCLFSIAVQVFFPYLIIYFSLFLGMKDYAVVLAIVLIAGSIFSVLMGPVIDRRGKLPMTTVGIAVMFIGLIGLYLTRTNAAVTVAGVVMMSGYMLIAATLSALIRDYTPADQVGVFQGVRMVFNVMLPMVIGPFIGVLVIRNGTGVYEELGRTKGIPTPEIFLAAAVALVFVLIPLFFLRRTHADKMG